MPGLVDRGGDTSSSRDTTVTGRRVPSSGSAGLVGLALVAAGALLLVASAVGPRFGLDLDVDGGLLSTGWPLLVVGLGVALAAASVTVTGRATTLAVASVTVAGRATTLAVAGGGVAGAGVVLAAGARPWRPAAAVASGIGPDSEPVPDPVE